MPRNPHAFSVAFLIALFTLTASAFAETVRGRVVDPHARPVAGAAVLVVRGGAVIATVTTIGDGRFGPVTLPPGEYEVLVSATGLSAEPTRVTLATGAPVDIEIRLALSAVKESVVVSAAQVDSPLTRVTDSVTVIDRTELDLRQITTVADALRLVPGIGVITSGGLGAITSIFPRGGNSDYTLVLVDGIPQNTFGGGFDAAHLGTADVDRIEVVRGPQSALYGDGAIGGVVQVITRRGGPPSLQASFEGGGYGTTRAAVSGLGSVREWQWGASVDRLATNGDTRFWPSLGRRVANADYDRVVGSGSLTWSDRPSRRVSVDVRADRDVRGNPGPYGSNPIGLYTGLDTISRGTNHSQEVGASAVFGGPGLTAHHLQVTWANLKGDFVSPSFTPGGPPVLSNDTTRRVMGRYQFDAALPALPLSAGWEFLHERADNTYVTGEQFQPVPVSRVVSGWFVEGRPSVGDRAFLHLGARLERIERSALEGNPGVRPAFGNDVVWSLNPKASGAWFVRPPTSSGWTKLHFNAGTGIKPPTAFDIAFTDNPNLKPERSRSVDVGVEQALVGSTVVADATAFANRYEDLIVTVGKALVGASAYKTDNIANARSRGLEAGLTWRARGGLAARAGWTWLDTAVLGVNHVPTLAQAPFTVGQPLIRRPRQQGSLEVSWSAARANAFVTVNGRGKMLDIEPNYGASAGLFNSPGFATVSLGGSITVMRRVEIFGRILNLLNRQYEETLGFPALGRWASVGVRIAAGR